MYLYSSFSYILAKKLRIDMGLKLLKIAESPDLKIGITLSNFNSVGNIPSRKDLFIRQVKCSM